MDDLAQHLKAEYRKGKAFFILYILFFNIEYLLSVVSLVGYLSLPSR